MRVEIHEYKGEQKEFDDVAGLDDQNGVRNNT